MGWLVWLAIFSTTFMLMEVTAWFLHKYVMHGFLWSLHWDHHNRSRDQKWEKNDFFALFFAVPSFLFILTDSLLDIPVFGAVGFGIMGYGIAYFLVHEVIIHRRLSLLPRINNWYIEAVNAAHKVHHSNTEKKNSKSLAMLVVPVSFFKTAWNKRH